MTVISTWNRACPCEPTGPLHLQTVGRSAVPKCATCGTLFTTDEVDALDEAEAALIELSTKTWFSKGTDTGESGTRKVQLVAARGLEALRRSRG